MVGESSRYSRQRLGRTPIQASFSFDQENWELLDFHRRLRSHESDYSTRKASSLCDQLRS